MVRFLLLCLAVSCYCQTFTIPEATLEFLSPKGLKISIPETDPDVSLVAFHVNVNQEFEGVEHGQWAADITKIRNGRWTYTINTLRVKPGDTVHFWVFVIRDGLGYQNLHRSHLVKNEDLQRTTSTTSAPVDWRMNETG